MLLAISSDTMSSEDTEKGKTSSSLEASQKEKEALLSKEDAAKSLNASTDPTRLEVSFKIQ
jgi:hypothetical protein